jgi:hypothetical protein
LGFFAKVQKKVGESGEGGEGGESGGIHKKILKIVSLFKIQTIK